MSQEPEKTLKVSSFFFPSTLDTLGIGTLPDLKRPILYHLVGNRLTVLASFKGIEEANKTVYLLDQLAKSVEQNELYK